MIWKDKVAVVTGAGGTLCSEIAVMLAGKGMKTVLVGRTAEKLEGTAEKIRARGGVCRIEAGDVNDEEAKAKYKTLDLPILAIADLNLLT